VVIIVLLAIAGVALLLLSWRTRAAVGLPVERVVYSDTDGWRRVEDTLVSRRYGLVGKPDYVVEERDGPVPVEVKPTRRAETPYLSDVLQLTAYCLLLEDVWGRAPKRGLLRYAEHTFSVEYTPDLRAVLLETLADMRAQTNATNVDRDHDEPGRCRACGVRAHCDQSLV
jgi:CRISPR-associated exonuclease Cas4